MPTTPNSAHLRRLASAVRRGEVTFQGEPTAHHVHEALLDCARFVDDAALPAAVGGARVDSTRYGIRRRDGGDVLYLTRVPPPAAPWSSDPMQGAVFVGHDQAICVAQAIPRAEVFVWPVGGDR